MSYDMRFAVKVNIGDEDIFVNIGSPEYDSPTYNLRKIFEKCMDWDYEQGIFYKCSEIETNVLNGVNELAINGASYKQYENPNGWGTVEDAYVVLTALFRDMHGISELKGVPLEYLYFAW